ncbi:tail protein [Lactobacillus phage 3-521]|uniref:Uncharacterized protein n=5 Tax=root TaxID=1 RepID=A0A4Y5FET3_9CAUD|nr:tail protein [Lactobacillus phage 3-521]QBJ03609.1 hypothetical protein UCC3521_0071 [Lactobacillus phage 3-521]
MADEVVSSLNKPTRRESALGKNVAVRDLSTNEQLYVSWGIVTNVYYKKGTLDFKTTLMGSSYTAMEKHNTMSGSAKIPVDFWGNNSDGKPFGSYRPISVGNRILVAYINGKTSSPVVIGVYPDTESSYELISPAIDDTSSIDGTTDEVGSDLATKKVYPSGQVYYQSGKGDLYRLFNGKSYFTVNSSYASRINRGIERLGQQGTYSDDSSDTSKSVMAGDWSLVHEDNTEKDTDNITNNHYTRVYLNRYGNLAIIATDKDSGQVVSMIEVSQNGGITLSKQYDGIGDDGIDSSIYTKLTVGDKDKTTSIISSDGTNTGTIDVSPDTVNVNGKPIANTQDTDNEINNAVSGITKEWTENLADEISKVQDEVQKATQEATDAANNAQQVGNQAAGVAEAAKQAASTAQEIANEAQTAGNAALIKANSAYDTGTQAQRAADNAQAAANSAAAIGNSAQEAADSVAAQAKKNTKDIAGLNEDTKDAQQTANSATQQANSAFDKANEALEGIQGISTTKSDKNVDPNRVKGVTVSPSSTMTFSDLNSELSDLQVNTVTFQIRVNFNNAKDSNPVLNVNDYAQVEGFLKKINTLDVIPKVLIEPLPVVSSGYVSPKNYTPTDVSSFFNSWTKIVSSVATMVNQYNVYGLYIGYAFDNLESYTDNWTSLISTVKPIFSGQLLYMSSYWTTATWDTNSNNKYQTKLAYPLWGMVDIIAIAPYFEVTDDAEPTASDLEGYFKNVPLYQRGQNIYQEIKNFYDKWKKPILLGDVGIPAYSGAAQAPYNGTTMSSQVVSSSIQESWLEAWYVTFEDLDWFKGINSYCIGNPYDSYNYDNSTSVYAYWKKIFYYEKSVNQSQIVQLDDMLATKVSDKDFTSQTVELSNQISTKVEQNQYDLDMTTKNTGVVDTNRIKGGNLSDKVQGSTSNIIDSINTLKLNSITLPIYITATDTSDSSPVVSDTDLTGLETSIKAVQANDNTTKILLEPYPLINKGTSSSSGWEPSSVDTWFTSWTSVMSKIAQLAAKYQVYGLYVGSKLDSLESYSSKWDTLITSIRSILSSLDTSTSKNTTRVLYETTHWVTSKDASDTQTAYQNKLNNPLFGYVDIIAIAAYFEVTDKVNPSVQDIKDGIYSVPIHDRGQNIYQEIKNFYDKWNKPILFGELGIPPYDQSASAPYQASIQPGWRPSDTIQHNWFAAWYEVFAPETWLLGFSIFNVGDSNSTYYVQSGDIASFLSQLNLYQSTVSQSQITQLVDDINFRVQKGDVITQINLDDSGVLIDGAKNHITGKTTIDDGIIKTAMIGDAQITDAKIDSLTASKLTAGTIDASVISVTNLNASNITTGTMSASKVVGGELDFNNIVAKNLTASSITSGTIDFSKIEGTNIDATNITTGNLNASLLTTGTINADLITTGTLDASKVVVANLSASSILTGTLDASKVTVSNIDASKIVTGTLDASVVSVINLNASNITAGTLTADLIKTGTFDISKVNVENFSANNIVAGTISGKDLSINLDTGAVNFESGTISGKDLSINLDTGAVNFESGNIKNSANTFEIDVTKGEILSGNNIGVMTINDADISYWKDTNASIWQGQIVLNRIAVGATYPSILLRSSDAIVMDPGNGNSPKDSTSSLTGASYFSGKFTDLATVTKLSEFDRGTNPGGYMYRAYESGTTDVGSDLTHLYINPYASWEVKLPPVYHSTGGNAGSPAFGSKPLVEVYGGGMYLNGSMQIYGSLAVGGAKQSIQPTRDGVRGLYAYETAESYFGDLGDSSTDSTCKVRINIETIFRDTVNTSFPYQVFISSYGKGTLWVSEKHSDYFVVESSLPNIPFGWEVKVRRRGSETDRLPKSDISLKQLQNMDEKHMDSK